MIFDDRLPIGAEPSAPSTAVDSHRLVRVIGVLLILVMVHTSVLAASATLDTFARCLTEKGVTLYAASWCPICKAQLDAFGDAAQYLDYVECAFAGSEIETPACLDARIASYPTWGFQDGSRIVGRVPLSELGAKAGCTLPATGADKAPRRARTKPTPPEDQNPPPRHLDPRF